MLLAQLSERPGTAAALVGCFPAAARKSATDELRRLLDEGLVVQRGGIISTR